MAEKKVKKEKLSLDVFKRALKDLGIMPTNVFAYKDYEESLVIVTKDGRKLVYERN